MVAVGSNAAASFVSTVEGRLFDGRLDELRSADDFDCGEEFGIFAHIGIRGDQQLVAVKDRIGTRHRS